MSISGCSSDRASLKNVFIAFVDEYNVMYGWAFSPANEERLIMADFPFLFFNELISSEVINDIDVQLTLMIFLIYS